MQPQKPKNLASNQRIQVDVPFKRVVNEHLAACVGFPFTYSKTLLTQ